MKVVVAICTWNRAALLDQTLAEMRKLRIPDGVEWEVLIVNNNCTDETDDVIGRHSPHLPLRRLFEPNPGQSNARNCAIEAASGELIVWTDDDVLVDPDWVAEYVNAAQKWEDAAFFGGQILPWFEGNPPKWLQQHWRTVEGVFAVRDLGEEPLPFSQDVVPFGANFAVRTDVQRRYQFDPNLGLRPNGNMRGEETAVIQRMLTDGLTGWWLPLSKVRHFIPKSRQTSTYLYSFYHGLGQYVGIQHNRGVRQLFGRPRWLWKSWALARSRYLVRRLVCRPGVWIEDLKQAAVLSGRLSVPIERAIELARQLELGQGSAAPCGPFEPISKERAER
jgi:glycosyltransferase involved in cell wall biosynthesis